MLLLFRGGVIQPPTVPVAAVADTSNATSYATASWTPVAGYFYLVAVGNSHGSLAVTPTSLVGNGQTWTQVATLVHSTLNHALTLYRCVASAPTTGVLTASFASTQTGCTIHVSEWASGLDTTGTNGAHAIVQVASNEGTAEPTDPNVTLAAFTDVDNATYAAGFTGSTTLGAGSGFTLLSNNSYATPGRNAITEYRLSNDTTPDYTAGTADWLIIGAELKATNDLSAVTAAGTWSQTASWAATGTETISGTATWTQPAAAWSGTSISAEDIFGDGAWEQVAGTWEGTGSVPVADTHPPGGAAVVTGPAGRKIRHIRGRGSFTQERGNWFARGSVNDDDQVLLLLES